MLQPVMQSVLPLAVATTMLMVLLSMSQAAPNVGESAPAASAQGSGAASDVDNDSELEKRLSSFVRIGRPSSFVRIGRPRSFVRIGRLSLCFHTSNILDHINHLTPNDICHFLNTIKSSISLKFIGVHIGRLKVSLSLSNSSAPGLSAMMRDQKHHFLTV